MRRIIFLLFALIGGPVLIVSGIQDYRNSKKLIAEGKGITGTVVDAIETVSRRSSTHHYYLVVRFQPEIGQPVQKKSPVSKEMYDQGIATRSVPITYLPSNPKILQVGERAHADTTGITIGSMFFLGGLGFLGFLWFSHRKSAEISTLGDTSTPTELKDAA